MARRRPRPPLAVYLNGRLVGHLRRLASGAIEFQYAESWLNWEHALPVSISLPLREDRYTGDSVIAVFDNLLPDGEPIRRRMAESVKADGHDAYSLLAAVGRDCVGALQFLPEGEAPGPAGKVAGHPISDTDISALLRSLANIPLGVGEDDDFRISIAGAQEKTALLCWDGQWYVPRGNTVTTHILKPQMGALPNGLDMRRSVENEHLCLQLTAALGLPSANTEIIDFDSERVLSVERFDRRWTRDGRLLRLPQEDFCQALSVPPTLKYDADGGPGASDIIGVLKGSDEPGADQRTFLKALIVLWLLGATDGHAKNFSIALKPGGRFNLAPLYDVMSLQPAADAGQVRRSQFKTALAIGDNRHYVIHEIRPRHFAQTAERNGLPGETVDEICAELAEAAEPAIEQALAALPKDFPEALAQSIVGGFHDRVSVMERAID